MASLLALVRSGYLSRCLFARAALPVSSSIDRRRYAQKKNHASLKFRLPRFYGCANITLEDMHEDNKSLALSYRSAGVISPGSLGVFVQALAFRYAGEAA